MLKKSAMSWQFLTEMLSNFAGINCSVLLYFTSFIKKCNTIVLKHANILNTRVPNILQKILSLRNIRFLYRLLYYTFNWFIIYNIFRRFKLAVEIESILLLLNSFRKFTFLGWFLSMQKYKDAETLLYLL
jgi:hypothetical protein